MIMVSPHFDPHTKPRICEASKVKAKAVRAAVGDSGPSDFALDPRDPAVL
jgi:hypothetical protein